MIKNKCDKKILFFLCCVLFNWVTILYSADQKENKSVVQQKKQWELKESGIWGHLDEYYGRVWINHLARYKDFCAEKVDDCYQYPSGRLCHNKTKKIIPPQLAQSRYFAIALSCRQDCYATIEQIPARLTLWDYAQNKILHKLDVEKVPYSVNFSHDDKQIFVGYNDHCIEIRDAKTLNLVHNIKHTHIPECVIPIGDNYLLIKDFSKFFPLAHLYLLQ